MKKIFILLIYNNLIGAISILEVRKNFLNWRDALFILVN